MPRRADPTTPTSKDDISKTDFAHQQRLHSFAYLPDEDRFLDLRHSLAGRRIVALRDAKGRLLREASIQSCLAARAAWEAELAEQHAAEQRKLALAETLAPSALPPCRADLDGPAAIAQLAEDFIVETTRNEGAAFTGLLRMGWQAAQLKRHAEAARIVAQRRQERQTEQVPA
jgi:hypothetical protein